MFKGVIDVTEEPPGMEWGLSAPPNGSGNMSLPHEGPWRHRVFLGHCWAGRHCQGSRWYSGSAYAQYIYMPRLT